MFRDRTNSAYAHRCTWFALERSLSHNTPTIPTIPPVVSYILCTRYYLLLLKYSFWHLWRNKECWRKYWRISSKMFLFIGPCQCERHFFFCWKNSAICPSSEQLPQDTDAFCFRHYPTLVLIGSFCPVSFGCSLPTRIYFPNKLALCAVMKFISDFRRQQAGTRIVYLSLPQGPGSSSYTERHQGPLPVSRVS